MTADTEALPAPPVLILDDDVAHASSVAALLAAYGIAAEAKADPHDVLASLADQPPDLLLLDLNMPLLGGLDVLAHMREQRIDVATIVLSGERDIGNIAPVLRLGAVDYLPKPFNPEQLINAVRNALERVRLTRTNRAMAAAVAAEQALQKLMLDVSPDAAYMLDDSGRLLFSNALFRALFHLPEPATLADSAGGPTPMGRDDWLGRVEAPLRPLLFPAHNQPIHSPPQAEGHGADRTRHVELSWTDCEGKSHLFDLALTPALVPGSAVPGVYGTLRDLSAQRNAETARLDLQNRLQQASKMESIGQIAGGIAHDFNNILASMVGYTELVRKSRHRLTEQRVDNYLDEVIHAGYRAKDLIQQMLAFTRASRGAPRTVDVGSAMVDVSRMLRAAIPAGVTLETRIDEGVAPVFADPTQLQQIMINLLVNARDALAGSGRIDVRLTEEPATTGICTACGATVSGRQVALTVADNGHGIASADCARMFDMYFTTRAPGKGTGIGLWLVNRLVHEYAGHVIVNSAPGAGAQFSVLFPPAPGEQANEVTQPQKRAPTSGRIVLVDDEVSVANFMSEAMRDAGYEVVVFNESVPALRYLEQHHAHVAALLTDHQMPVMTGVTLAERARAIRADLPIAVVSAHLESADIAGGLFDRRLAKPFRMDELAALLDELIQVAPFVAEQP